MDLVFEREFLDLFYNGTTCLYNILLDVANYDDVTGPYPRELLIKRLQTSIRDHWDSIQDIFLHDPYHDLSNGNFEDHERHLPAKLFIDLTSELRHFHTKFLRKIEETHASDAKMTKENQSLNVELDVAKKELLDVRLELNRTKAETNTLTSALEHARQVSQQKSDKIAQLQRDSTVVLWEQEKQRLLEGQKQREEELKARVNTLEKDRQILSEKNAEMEKQIKLEKMRGKIHAKSTLTRSELEAEVKKMEQHIYVLEKDVKRMDLELHNQQKYTVGILSGLKEEIETTFSAHLDKDDVSAPLDYEAKARIRWLLGITGKAKTACQEGKLGILRADLPENFLAVDRDVKGTTVKKLSTGYSMKTGDDGTGKRKPSAINENGEIVPAPEAEPPTSTGSEHPVLVDPDTGIPQMIRVLQNFPHMTQEYVKEQWDQFKRYDTNSDGSLDIAEMMSAMSATIGQQFTAVQIKEAMLEVDKDGSNTLDFYEYLIVADMLMSKSGRAGVFQSGFIRQQGRHVSKTCSVM